MKEHVKDMFTQVTMPEESVQKIRCAMAEKARGKAHNCTLRPLRPATVMAGLLAVLLFASVAMNNEVQAAVNDLVRYVIESAQFRRNEETGELMEIFEPVEDGTPVFVEVGDGKIYFSYDGQYIDITDKTSMETPYIYTYVDESNVEHTLIIGGEPDNFGVCEFYREIVEGQQDWQGWIGGYSSNYCDNTTEKTYPWLAAAWEELNLPWPMPGA